MRSCVRGKPRMGAILATAIEIAEGMEYLQSQVSVKRSCLAPPWQHPVLRGIVHDDLSSSRMPPSSMQGIVHGNLSSWNVLLTGKGVDSDAHGRAFIPKVLCQ